MPRCRLKPIVVRSTDSGATYTGTSRSCDQRLDAGRLAVEHEHSSRLVRRVDEFGDRRVALDDEVIEVPVLAQPQASEVVEARVVRIVDRDQPASG